MSDTKKYYVINTKKANKQPLHSYILAITTKYSYETNQPVSHNINIGGKIKGCVQIVVNVPNIVTDPRFAAIEENKKVAYISWIGFNKKCAINHDLPSGAGTRHMVRTALTIVLNTYDWVTSFSLTDASKVDCNGYNVSLKHISLSLHGKTYYERYLHTHLADESNQTKYNKGIFLLKNRVMDFERMCEFVEPQHKSIVKHVYSPTLTHIEFFNKLSEQCRLNNIKYCELSCIEHIINSCFEGDVLNEKWIIDADKVNLIAPLEWSDFVDASRIQEIDMIIQEEFVKGGAKMTALLSEDDY